MFSCPHTAPRCSTTAFLSATKPSYIYTPANHGPRAQLSVWRGPSLFYILIAVVLRAQCWGALCPPTPTTTSPTTATINPDAPCHVFSRSIQHNIPYLQTQSFPLRCIPGSFHGTHTLPYYEKVGEKSRTDKELVKCTS